MVKINSEENKLTRMGKKGKRSVKTGKEGTRMGEEGRKHSPFYLCLPLFVWGAK